eukprot:7389707-Prymnesium_polylepis.1
MEGGGAFSSRRSVRREPSEVDPKKGRDGIPGALVPSLGAIDRPGCVSKSSHTRHPHMLSVLTAYR